MKNTYVVELEEDPETGELILPFPDELIAKMGWVEGDTLIWGSTDAGIFVAKKEESEND